MHFFTRCCWVTRHRELLKCFRSRSGSNGWELLVVVFDINAAVLGGFMTVTTKYSFSLKGS